MRRRLLVRRAGSNRRSPGRAPPSAARPAIAGQGSRRLTSECRHRTPTQPAQRERRRAPGRALPRPAAARQPPPDTPEPDLPNGASPPHRANAATGPGGGGLAGVKPTTIGSAPSPPGAKSLPSQPVPPPRHLGRCRRVGRLGAVDHVHRDVADRVRSYPPGRALAQQLHVVRAPRAGPEARPSAPRPPVAVSRPTPGTGGTLPAPAPGRTPASHPGRAAATRASGTR